MLAEQRYLFGKFVHLHQIVFEKIVKPRRILLFLIVLRKVAEPIAVVEIQAIQTADLLDFVFSCGQAVLPDNIGLWLERLEHDIIPVGNKPFKDFLFGVFLAEPVSPYRFFAAFRCDRSVLTIRTEIRVIAITPSSYWNCRRLRLIAIASSIAFLALLYRVGIPASSFIVR